MTAFPDLPTAVNHSLMLKQGAYAAAHATWVAGGGPQGAAGVSATYIAAIASADALHLDRVSAANQALGNPAPLAHPSARPRRAGAQSWLTTLQDSGS